MAGARGAERAVGLREHVLADAELEQLRLRAGEGELDLVWKGWKDGVSNACARAVMPSRNSLATGLILASLRSARRRRMLKLLTPIDLTRPASTRASRSRQHGSGLSDSSRSTMGLPFSLRLGARGSEPSAGTSGSRATFHCEDV